MLRIYKLINSRKMASLFLIFLQVFVNSIHKKFKQDEFRRSLIVKKQILGAQLLLWFRPK